MNIPKFLVDELQDYIGKVYGIMSNERNFHCTSSYLTSEMKRGVTNTGVQKIRLHDLRHSHASLLVEMGVTPLEMVERLGHEKIETILNIYSYLYPNNQASWQTNWMGSLRNRRKKNYEWSTQEFYDKLSYF